MKAHTTLAVEKRDSFGTGSARACRKNGKIPGIIYGEKKDPQGFSIDPKLLLGELYKPNFFSTIFEINAGGQKEQILVKDVQIDPVTDYPMHIDFMRVSKDTQITVSIPLHFINEDKAPLLKRGGILNIVRHALEIKAKADAVPESFTVDLASIDLSKGVHLDILTMPVGVAAAHPARDRTLATVVTKKVKEEGEAEAA